jgi:hypothetical protein
MSIDWIEPLNLALGLIGGAVVTNWINTRAERRRSDREDQLHAQRIKREDRQRFLNERREAYVEFIAVCREFFSKAGTSAGRDLYPLLRDIGICSVRTGIVAPEQVKNSAQAAYDAVLRANASPPQSSQELAHEYLPALEEFGVVARRDVREGGLGEKQ